MNVQEKSIVTFLNTIVNRWLLIVSITLLFTLAAGIVSFFVLPPVYEATSKVLVNEVEPAQGEIDPATSFYQMETSFKLFDTFIVVAGSPQVLDKVIENLSLSDSYRELSEKVSINQIGESLAIELKVKDEDPQQALRIVNEISAVLNAEISKLYGENQLSVLTEQSQADMVLQVTPKPYLNMIVAFFAGLVISMGAAFLLEHYGKTFARREVKSETHTLVENSVFTKINKL
ncbi:YveK family protein [Domibacillus indicus]|uniref:YveK family protein n=1 Tax=Domibacillus indicus TaxID=1437523 RepID=UPI0006180163|nr:Wzz/FepE/Etk N-terminal domain-containing protein [Domibacillus indicus]